MKTSNTFAHIGRYVVLFIFACNTFLPYSTVLATGDVAEPVKQQVEITKQLEERIVEEKTEDDTGEENIIIEEEKLVEASKKEVPLEENDENEEEVKETVDEEIIEKELTKEADYEPEEEQEDVQKEETDEETISDISLGDKKSSISESTIIKIEPEIEPEDAVEEERNIEQQTKKQPRKWGYECKNGSRTELSVFVCSYQDFSEGTSYSDGAKVCSLNQPSDANCEQKNSENLYECKDGSWERQFFRNTTCGEIAGTESYNSSTTYENGDKVCSSSTPNNTTCVKEDKKRHYTCGQGTWKELPGMCPTDGSVADYNSSGSYTDGESVCYTSRPNDSTCTPPKEKKKWKCQENGEWTKLSDWCSGHATYDADENYESEDIVCSVEKPSNDTCEEEEDDQEELTCDGIDVSSREIYEGDSVSVTCYGNNVETFEVYAMNIYGGSLPTQRANDSEDGEEGEHTFEYTISQVGTYALRCMASNPDSFPNTTFKPGCRLPVKVDVKKKEKDVVCEETAIEPEIVVVGDAFEITCEGENIEKYSLDVKLPGGNGWQQAFPMQTNNTFAYTPNQKGTYGFRCQGWGNDKDVTCPEVYGEAKKDEKVAVCTEVVVDPQEIKKGESFQVTCAGEHVMKWRMIAKDAQGNIISNQMRNDFGGDDKETFTVTPSTKGKFTFECIGWADAGATGKDPLDSCFGEGWVKEDEKKYATCDEIVIDPSVIKEGEEFTVTCEGSHIKSRALVVTEPGKSPVQTAVQESNVFVVQGNKEGEYGFQCKGRKESGTIGGDPVTSYECKGKGTVEKEKKEAICKDITVTPEWINTGETFTVECTGEHIASRALRVTNPDGNVTDTAIQSNGTFTIAGTKEGVYRFECLGWKEPGTIGGDPVRSSACEGNGEVKKKKESATCDDLILDKRIIDKGDNFTVICEGTGIEEWKLRVKKMTSQGREDYETPYQEGNVFEIEGDKTGNYWFECVGKADVSYDADGDVTSRECRGDGKVKEEQKKYAVCEDIEITPGVIKKGEEFTVVCEGEHIASWALKVTSPSGEERQTAIQVGNEFTIEGEEVGNYRFQCLGWKEPGTIGGDPVTSNACMGDGQVEDEKEEAVCTDITVTPSVIKEGEEFTVVCEGIGIEEWKLRVKKMTSQGREDYETAYQEGNVFEIEGDKLGNYWFECVGKADASYDANGDVTSRECRGDGKVEEKKEGLCEYAKVTPEWIKKGEEFTIECQGKHVKSRRVKVTNPNGGEEYLPLKQDTNNDDKEVFTYVGTQKGEYTFTCEGRVEEGYRGPDPITCEDTGTVKEDEKATCDDIIVEPSSVIKEGEKFNVTCEGTGIEGWKLQVTKMVNGQNTTYFLPANGTQGSNEFEVDGDEAGSYRLKCYGSAKEGFSGGENVTSDACRADPKVEEKDEKEAICKDITVTPEWINTGETFEITCEGENIQSRRVEVTRPNGTIEYLPLKQDSNDDDTEFFTYTADVTGVYTFTCQGWAEEGFHGEPTCSETGQVKDICIDPVSSVTIDSHTHLEEVTTRQITVSGSFVGDVDQVKVVVKNSAGNTTYQGVVDTTTSTWEATIDVEDGGNIIEVTASSNTPKCGKKKTSTKLIYTPKELCEDPITQVTIGSPVDGLETTQESIEVSGTFEGGVDEVLIRSNSTVGALQFPATILGTTWSATVPLFSGVNVITAVANSDDELCDSRQDKITIERTGEDVCIDPITSLTIDSHVFGEVVTPGPAVISGTVQGGVEFVGVQIEDFIILADVVGNVRSTTIQVGQAGRSFTVRANPNDLDCDDKQVQGFLRGEPTTKKSDPAIEVTCDYSNEITCSETMSCTAVIVNTLGSQAPAENLQAYLDLVAGNRVVSGSIVEQVLQGDSLSCEKTTDQRISCTGEIAVGSQAEVSFDVRLAPCNCEGSNVFVYEGTVQASNGDLNLQNNYDSWNKTILSDEECTNECPDNQIGLVVTAPGKNTKTTSNSVTVQGRVSDRSATVLVDGDEVSVDNDGEFEKEVFIPEGTTTIRIEAQIDGEDACEEVETVTVTREARGRGGSGGRKSSIRCGDGYIDYRRGEECDDGNYRNGDGCSSSCQIEDVAECGNGILELYEQCDDGNRRDGDGCDAVCNLEDDIVREKIRQIKIKDVLIDRKRPEPLSFTPPAHPPVLPKTGAEIVSCEEITL